MKTFKQFLKENKESLCEMSRVFSNVNPYLTLWVENPTGYNNQYFKLYNSNLISKATKVARISMLKPNYLIHKNDDGKENWILNNKEKKDLVNLLKKPMKIYSFITNWQYMILVYNRDNFDIDELDLLSGEISIKEYNDNVKFIENALPLDLKIPDYMKL